MSNFLPNQMTRTINDLFRDVPHATATARWSHQGTSAAVSLTLHVDGWDPTLHEGVHDVHRIYPDERRMLADVIAVATQAAADQQALADHALAEFGLAQPLYTSAFDARRTLDPNDADHVSRMWIERVLADALVQTHGANGAAERTVRALDSLQRSTARSACQMRHGGDEVEFRDGRIVLEPELLIGGPTMASLMGATLSMRVTIPETLAMAATGRPLGTVVETRLAALDAAPIAGVRRMGDTLQLSTPSDAVRIGEHPGLAAGLASVCKWRAAA